MGRAVPPRCPPRYPQPWGRRGYAAAGGSLELRSPRAGCCRQSPEQKEGGGELRGGPTAEKPRGGGRRRGGCGEAGCRELGGGGSRSGGPQQQFTVEVSWRPFAQPTSPPPSFSTGRGEARQALHPPAPRGPPPRSSTRRAPRSAARPEPGSEQRSVTGGGTEGHRKRILPCKEMSRSHLTPLSSSPSSPPPPRLTPQQTKGSERGAKGAAPAGNGADGEGRRSDTTKRQRAPIGLSAGLGGTVQPPLLLGTTAAGGGTCKDTAA